MIAALFVEKSGIYYGMKDVDPWDMERDARLYRGPWSAVCHPDCGRWGRYWFGGPSVKERRLRGDDCGCFAHALWVSRTFGGVIEHPAGSSAWPWFGLPIPNPKGGWTERDRWGGASCHVEQGHYGHPARKATNLYAVSKYLPELIWGPSSRSTRLEEGFHSSGERARARALQVSRRSNASRRSRESRPPDPFAICSFLSPSEGHRHEAV